MARNYRQGKYKVANKEKYVGTADPTYRSSYELEVFQFLDRAPAVIKWGAEVIVVPYFNESKGRKARYIVDVYVKYKNRQGELREELIEIKPMSQVKKPVRGKKRQDVYDNEVLTYVENLCKWTAAKKYAEKRKWTFRILTENSIFR